MKYKNILLNYYPIIIVLSLFVFSFQNCGNVNVDPIQFSSQSTVGMELALKPPTSFKWNRRYVFFVDMSYSMVSGPCPFDVDVTNTIHGFTGPYVDYDPNFPTAVNFNDSRYRVADCSVDPSYPFGKMTLDFRAATSTFQMPNHKTFKGADFEANRLNILKSWIAQMRDSNNAEFLQRTQVLILPSASGSAFERLMENYPLKGTSFVSLTNPKVDEAIAYLIREHNATKESIVNKSPEARFRDDPNLDKNKMGTSSYYDTINKSFPLIDKEMEKLATAGELTQTSFKMIAFADQRVNPLADHFTKALSYFSSCTSCPNELTKAWGSAAKSDLSDVDLKLSLIQGLTKYYGAGLVETEFLHLNSNSADYPVQFQSFNLSGAAFGTGEEFPANQKLLLNFLNTQSLARNASSLIIPITTGTPPYRIANVNTGITTFKTTNVFLLNMNFKIDNNGKSHLDTDGDGATDEQETVNGSDPLNPRSNGFCLDSIMLEPTLKTRCEGLSVAGLCSPTLDSDGDGLNECDELTLGSDPYDFDTDGDGIPDILEVLSGNNTLIDDNTTDSNADGISDLMNFTMGLGPLPKPQFVNPLNLIKVSLNFLKPTVFDDATLGKVRVDNLDLTIENFPLAKTNTVSSLSYFPATYFLRTGARGFDPVTSLVNPAQSMIKPILRPNTNNLIALLRIVDPDEPQKVYWEILSSEINTNVGQANLGKINISQFTQIKVVDRVQVQK